MLDTDNRVTAFCKNVQASLDAGGVNGAYDTPEKLAALDASLSISFEEHFAFQQQQAQAHAMEKITTDEAQTIYAALGESLSTINGGWKPHVSTAMKYTITQIMGELLTQQVKRRR